MILVNIPGSMTGYTGKWWKGLGEDLQVDIETIDDDNS